MLPELPECSHWWKCPFTPGEEIERLRGEVELLRHERDTLKAELARHYTLSSDEDKYVFDRDMKAQFSAIDAAREG